MLRVLTLLWFCLFSGSVFGSEYIIKYKNPTEKFKISFNILDAHVTGNLLKADLQDDQVQDLKQDPNVEYIVKNATVHAFYDTETLREQWALLKVKAAEAWRVAGTGHKSVVVAVIDTGVDYNHESLKDNMADGYDFRDDDADPMDLTSSSNPGHGTHCAGIIGATGMVSNGVAGMSPVVTLMPIRFLGADGSGDLMAGIKSIDYAIEKGAKVISASWGAVIDRANAMPLVEAVERADKAGVIFVSAAANNGKNNDVTEVYPANAGFPNTITVAASDVSDAKPSWSNFGKATVHVAAPGNAILSTLPNNRYSELSGTSMATPLVSGLAALLLSQDDSLSGAEIRALLQKSGAPVEIETACNCRVDAEAAVKTVQERSKWLVPSAASLDKDASILISLKNAAGAVSYSSSDTAVMTVDHEGKVTAVGAGSAKIKAVDQDGTVTESLDFHVKGTPTPPPPGEECPFQDPAMCDLFCEIIPTLPWCN